MSNKPLCDRCNAPATVHEIDGALLCDKHHAEEMRIREYAKVRVYGSGPVEDSAMGPWRLVEGDK